ncbi:MAG: hypothetical protein OXG36_13165 [Caldilineaceae bacterium]|nr:hypothetical protein [Caldilineaceae bacterium]
MRNVNVVVYPDHPDMVVVLDTTGFPGKGIHLAGVERPYSDMLDRVTNCQVGARPAFPVDCVALSPPVADGGHLLSRETEGAPEGGNGP